MHFERILLQYLKICKLIRVALFQLEPSQSYIAEYLDISYFFQYMYPFNSFPICKHYYKIISSVYKIYKIKKIGKNSPIMLPPRQIPLIVFWWISLSSVHVKQRLAFNLTFAHTISCIPPFALNIHEHFSLCTCFLT